MAETKKKNNGKSTGTSSAKKSSSSASAKKKTASSQNRSSNSSTKKTPSRKSPAPSKSSAKKSNSGSSREVWEWFLLLSMIFVALCVFMGDELGLVGGAVQSVLVGFMGISAYFFVFLVIFALIFHMFAPDYAIGTKLALSFIFLIFLSTLFHLINGKELLNSKACYEQASFKTGGWIGGILGNWMVTVLNRVGSYIVLIGLMLLIVGTLIGVSLKSTLKTAGDRTAQKARELSNEAQARREERIERREAAEKERIKAEKAARTPIKDGPIDISTLESDIYTEKKRRYEQRQKELENKEPLSGIQTSIYAEKKEEEANEPVISEKPEKKKRTAEKTEPLPEEPVLSNPPEEGIYHFPPIELLSLPNGAGAKSNKQELLNNAKILEDALMSFGVEAHVTQVNQGPAVTRYELAPRQGVKVSRIVNLADDIALNLAAPAIRIEAPIPGKAAVGIEVPNKDRATVTLREVIDSPEFSKSRSKVTFALGKNIDGEIEVADIAKMPHLLIAGATGSGKSVCINSIIVSLLYKADPNDVQMLLIDPKVVELSVYNGIPHLCTPNRKVITDSKLAAASLNKMVSEMTGRYQKFADLNVRDIVGYNEAVDQLGDEEHQKMPQIVVIIDELADLMMVASKEVEESICRLAQMARAAGIHLIIATQRPSVDVITGLIKANIPSRLAFAVSSGIDSRTILDMVGAEKLLGRGDMLFCPIGASKPTRIQGTFVSDHEVEAVVEAVRSFSAPDNLVKLPEVLAASSSDGADSDEEDEEHMNEAIEFVVRNQKVSISLLQREFRIGFNRAARMVDELEEKGIVSPQGTNGKRTVLMSWAEYCCNKDSE